MGRPRIFERPRRRNILWEAAIDRLARKAARARGLNVSQLLALLVTAEARKSTRAPARSRPRTENSESSRPSP